MIIARAGTWTFFCPIRNYSLCLDPRKRDFQFETQPDDCVGDGVRSLKLVFDKVGEIDFIVAGALTTTPAVQSDIDGEAILLETIPEIIAKKIYYRSSSIKPRDIFDIAAAGEQHVDSVIKELRSYRGQVKQTLVTIDALNPDFVNRAIAQLAIKDPYKGIANVAIERSQEILRAV